MENENYEQLEPHVYPLWIKIGISACLAVLLLFITELPYHFQMHKEYKEAEHAFQNKQYEASQEAYLTLAEKFPQSRHTLLRTIASLLCIENKENHMDGFRCLEVMQLTYQEWKELKKYIPNEYVALLQESSKLL